MPSGFTGSTPQALCHPERKAWAKGLCRSCYYKPYIKKRKEEGVTWPSHTPGAKKQASLKSLGWTLEMFEETLVEQHNKCAICSKELNLDKKQNSSRACADHEHVKPPKPRGILCTNCNAMIGQAQENPQILRAAADYIEKFLLSIPAEEVKTM